VVARKQSWKEIVRISNTVSMKMNEGFGSDDHQTAEGEEGAAGLRVANGSWW
jgi:hypothetical protein